MHWKHNRLTLRSLGVDGDRSWYRSFSPGKRGLWSVTIFVLLPASPRPIRRPPPSQHTCRTESYLPYRILTKKANIRRIGSLVNQLMSRRGYAQAFANEEIHRVIAATVGTPLDSGFAVGKLQAGVLQVYASDSVTLQELNFQKRKILRNIQQDMPGNQVTDLRFRIQA